jgi:hypothetical protein
MGPHYNFPRRPLQVQVPSIKQYGSTAVRQYPVMYMVLYEVHALEEVWQVFWCSGGGELPQRVVA